MMGLSHTIAFCDEIAFTGSSHQFVGKSFEFLHYNIKLHAFFCMHCQASVTLVLSTHLA